MANIEIITSTPTALSANILQAASVADDLKTGVVKAARSLASGFTVTNVVDPVALAKNLKGFLNDIQPVLDEVSLLPGNFRINEMELNLAISAEGGIKLIGDLSTGIHSSITLKLTRTG
jgi:hypothetical protein